MRKARAVKSTISAASLVCCPVLFIGVIAFTGVALFRFLPEYAGAVRLFLAHCNSIELMPVTAMPMLRLLFPWLAILIMAAGFVAATRRALRRGLVGRRLLKGLRLVEAGSFPGFCSAMDAAGMTGRVRLFASERGLCAFTWGLWKPRTYLSTFLVSRLSEEELLSVLLHEKYHLERKSPLRLLAITFAADWLFFFPLSRYCAGLFHRRHEEEADDGAVAACGGSLGLAGTLLKVAKLNLVELPASIGISDGSGSSLERRVSRLLGMPVGLGGKRLIGRACASLVVTAVLFGPFFSRALSSSDAAIGSFRNFVREVCLEHGEHAEALAREWHTPGGPHPQGPFTALTGEGSR